MMPGRTVPRIAMPRLAGEPLALDLVNTRWPEHGHDVDLLDDPDALTIWLDEHHLVAGGASAAAVAAYQQPLRDVRAAIRGLLEGSPGAVQDLNDALAHGRLRLTIDGGRPGERVELDDPAWEPAWTAARAYLHLLASAPPSRIRQCDGAGCVLWFQDTSRNGTRRWCSMTGCGNRAKAQAHYHRQRADAANPPEPLKCVAAPKRQT